VPPETFLPDSSGEKEWIKDIVTPHYKNVIQNGGIVNNRMSKYRVTFATTTSGPQFQTVIGGITYTGDLAGPHWTTGILNDTSRPDSRPKFTDDINNLQRAVGTQAYANVMKTPYSGAVSIGELKETLTYLRNPLAAGIKLGEAIRRNLTRSGIFRRYPRLGADHTGGNISSNIASVHLSIVYGFKPLVKDIFDIVENLRTKVHNFRPKRITARAQGSITLYDTWETTESFSGISYTAKYKWEQVVTVRSGILHTRDIQYTVYDEWGVNVRDIPSALWAITPLSFVADWFGNIGDLIAALTPKAGFTFLASWTSTTYVTKLTRSVSGYQFSNWVTSRDGKGNDSVVTTRYEREPVVHFGLAHKDLTDLKNDVSRLTSLISILRSRLSPGVQYERTSPRRSTSRVRRPGDYSRF